MGYAVTPKRKFGRLATVFPEQVREKAGHPLAKRYSVLGHDIDHAIDHLLLAEARHSGEGMKKDVWSAAELFRASAYGMRFTPTEIRKSQENLWTMAQVARWLAHETKP